MAPTLPASSRSYRGSRPRTVAHQRPSGRSHSTRTDRSTITSPTTRSRTQISPGIHGADHPATEHNHSPPQHLTGGPVQIKPRVSRRCRLSSTPAARCLSPALRQRAALLEGEFRPALLLRPERASSLADSDRRWHSRASEGHAARAPECRPMPTSPTRSRLTCMRWPWRGLLGARARRRSCNRPIRLLSDFLGARAARVKRGPAGSSRAADDSQPGKVVAVSGMSTSIKPSSGGPSHSTSLRSKRYGGR
jgi:hypothetical protein